MTTQPNDLENDKIFHRRVQTDERLDILYMHNIRCPYCQTKVPKGTAKCKNCGLSKEQLYHAPLVAPYKPGRQVLMSKIRPESLPFWKIGLGSVFGFLGIHCFIAKRYLRGAVMLLLTIAFFALLVVFPPSFGEEVNAVRDMFESRTYLFPGDLVGIVALGLWVFDMFAVFFGQFKYPVLPEIKEEA